MNFFREPNRYDPSLECVGFVGVRYRSHMRALPVFKIRLNSPKNGHKETIILVGIL